jgi:hypothetical protein
VTAALTLEDQLAIRDLATHYANILDRRQFDRAGEVFTTDAVYDLSDLGYGVVHGVEAIVAFWEESLDHPVAHHATDAEVGVDDAGAVRMYSKILGVGRKGRVGSAEYDDVVVQTSAGWRIAERVVRLRRGT